MEAHETQKNIPKTMGVQGRFLRLLRKVTFSTVWDFARLVSLVTHSADQLWSNSRMQRGLWELIEVGWNVARFRPRFRQWSLNHIGWLLPFLLCVVFLRLPGSDGSSTRQLISSCCTKAIRLHRYFCMARATSVVDAYNFHLLVLTDMLGTCAFGAFSGLLHVSAVSTPVLITRGRIASLRHLRALPLR